ncbi:hypothetical protein RR48_13520 [Papilio machaon]|uniref:Uncharacterized protein n=1 Tax=Papilio machaon TaxID=76193 RepID=A0A194RAC0_PAPMA|nr:hypothetical protein RR48_13520 [Papilio machaon]
MPRVSRVLAAEAPRCGRGSLAVTNIGRAAEASATDVMRDPNEATSFVEPRDRRDNRTVHSEKSPEFRDMPSSEPLSLIVFLEEPLLWTLIDQLEKKNYKTSSPTRHNAPFSGSYVSSAAREQWTGRKQCN